MKIDKTSRQGAKLRAGPQRWRRRIKNFQRNISINVSAEMRAELEKLADSQVRSVSDVARRAIESGLPLLGTEIE